MSVGSILGGGIRLVRTQPQVVAIWAALYVLLAAVGMMAMRPFLASVMMFQQQMATYQQQAAAARAAGVVLQPPPFVGQVMTDIFGLDVIVLLFMIIGFAAVVRAVVRPGGDRFAYLRLGMDELRLLGLGLLFLVAAIVVELVAILVAVLVGFVLALVIGKAATAVAMAVLLLALFCGGIYLEVRLSLAGVYTVMRRKIIIGDAWRATRGKFWTLFGVYAVLTIAYLVLTLIIVGISNPHLLMGWTALDQQAQMVAAQEQMARLSSGLSPGIIVQTIIFSIPIVLFGSVATGAVATAALELAPVDRVDRSI